MMPEKKFRFASDAAGREYKKLPANIQKDFGSSLNLVQNNIKPFLPITQLSSIGAGVFELKIQGSPAYRCVYIAKYANTVFVLHSFVKTTNKTDQQAINTATKRYKELMAKLSAIANRNKSGK
ncbi:type II toxin-antitoxin system RelE/ParE family toxin [Pleurocapsa sp. FMAR1]|uniref:type II toxin-antitoxin system RelE/ParE family toxin n=1 Tax=Pleurocapsa sp. FMAR1 TaxID=3040204 RepID=UPI0029C82BDB|nr:type II toxin-antitoxin system RelE/ParE family toxin [Pleurocapsa sp. FMAR1]